MEKLKSQLEELEQCAQEVRRGGSEGREEREGGRSEGRKEGVGGRGEEEMCAYHSQQNYRV